MDYTVIGDNVNTAARLEENARRGEILITESTYSAVKDMVTIAGSSDLKVKGKEKLIHTYSVTGLK